jgi:hypothetical protein
MKRDEIDNPQKRPRAEQQYGRSSKKLFPPLRFDYRGGSMTAMKFILQPLQQLQRPVRDRHEVRR